MKRSVFFLLFFSLSFFSVAQLSGDGFYRLQNRYTGRFVHLRDGYGRVDISSIDADMSAVQTVKPYEKCLSDPASIMYITYVPSDLGYDLYCQGTSLHSIINYYVKMKPNGDYCQAYAENSGYTVYLVDYDNDGADLSCLAKFKGGMKLEQRDWSIIPVNQNEGCYLGVSPSIDCNAKYYSSYYASFPFSFYSSGMKAFYVSKVDPVYRVAVYKEITAEVPAATPVFVECSSSDVAQNRLDVHTSTVSAPSDNLLKGVYFCRVMSKADNPHNFYVKNDTSTMRVLGLLSDGSLGYIKSAVTYMPENSSYLNVPANTPAELKLVTPEEYALITGLPNSFKEVISVRYYNMMGQELSEQVEGLCVIVTTYNDGSIVKGKAVIGR